MRPARPRLRDEHLADEEEATGGKQRTSPYHDSIGKADFKIILPTKTGRAGARTVLGKVTCDGEFWKAKRGQKLPK